MNEEWFRVSRTSAANTVVSLMYAEDIRAVEVPETEDWDVANWRKRRFLKRDIVRQTETYFWVKSVFEKAPVRVPRKKCVFTYLEMRRRP